MEQKVISHQGFSFYQAQSLRVIVLENPNWENLTKLWLCVKAGGPEGSQICKRYRQKMEWPKVDSPTGPDLLKSFFKHVFNFCVIINLQS